VYDNILDTSILKLDNSWGFEIYNNYEYISKPVLVKIEIIRILVICYSNILIFDALSSKI
jgi:hypothetical protein